MRDIEHSQRSKTASRRERSSSTSRDRGIDRDRVDDRYDRARHRDHRPHPKHHRSRSHEHEGHDASRRRHSPRGVAKPRQRSRSRSPARKARGPLPSQNESFANDVGLPSSDKPPKEKPNFKPTGLLAKEANTVAGTTTVLKYHEPPEARKPPPSQQWRMYVFKQKDLVDTVYLHERSCWLIGRDQKITDLFLEHPSISKQHAVIQFRHSSSLNEFGDKINRVKPYLIDLESANGTKLNGKTIGESRYIELADSDVICFGQSEREYVMMLPPVEK